MAHPSARLTARGRPLLAERVAAGWTITAAARAAGISRQTGSKWWRRARDGEFVDRSSRVHHQARQHPPEVVARLCARRRELRAGPHILAWEAELPRSTAYAVLRRHGLARLDRLEPRPTVVRYEREHPGELVHLDTKQLGRIDGAGPSGHRQPGRAPPGVAERGTVQARPDPRDGRGHGGRHTRRVRGVAADGYRRDRPWRHVLPGQGGSEQ